MNVYDVFRFFILGLINGSVSTRAAAISFRLFVAFFPAMLLLLSIVPFTPLETQEVLLSLEYFFPKQAIDLFEQTVTGPHRSTPRHLAVGGSGVIGLLRLQQC